MSTGIRGLLLCGGSATRFGSDKLLHPVESRGETAALVSHSARNLLAGARNALAVIPPGASALRRALEAAGCDILESQETRGGLGASLAAAVSSCREAVGWIVALGDMPFIRPETIAAVRETLAGGALIAAPFLANAQRGHPVGFAHTLGDELAALSGDDGARSVIARHRAGLVPVPVADPGIVADIDTPDDLERRG